MHPVETDGHSIQTDIVRRFICTYIFIYKLLWSGRRSDLRARFPSETLWFRIYLTLYRGSRRPDELWVHQTLTGTWPQGGLGTHYPTRVSYSLSYTGFEHWESYKNNNFNFKFSSL